jgi:hypothetical protein
MALDVSRYLAWESIIYPDGGTCVLLPRSRAAPGRPACGRSERPCSADAASEPATRCAPHSFEGHSEAGLCEGLGNMRYADGDR